MLHAESSLWNGIRQAATSRLDLVRGSFQGPNGATVFTDARNAGYGAAWGEAELQGLWSAEERQLHIE